MTKLLNIDEIVNEAPKHQIQLNGEMHEMHEPTVKDFIKNLRAFENLAESPSPSQEVEMMVDVVSRAFPTVKRSDFEEMSLDKINKIFEFARGFEEVEGDGDTENPSKEN